MRNIHPEFEFYKGGAETLRFALPVEIKAAQSAWLVLAQNYKTVETVELIIINTGQTSNYIDVSLSADQTEKFDAGDVEAQISYTDAAGGLRYFPPVYGRCLRTFENTSTNQ